MGMLTQRLPHFSVWIVCINMFHFFNEKLSMRDGIDLQKLDVRTLTLVFESEGQHVK